MTLEQQVVSLDIAKKLKELGVKQESIHYWGLINGSGGVWCKHVIDQMDERETRFTWISAFTVAELGEMLPPEQPNFPIRFDNKWGTLVGHFTVISDTNEANCRAKVLIYLIENKII